MPDNNIIESAENKVRGADKAKKFNRIFKLCCAILFIATLLTSIILSIVGAVRVNADMGEYEIQKGYWYLFKRTTTPDEED